MQWLVKFVGKKKRNLKFPYEIKAFWRRLRVVCLNNHWIFIKHFSQNTLFMPIICRYIEMLQKLN